MVNADSAAVRKRVRKIGRQYGYAAAFRGTGAAFQHAIAGRRRGALAFAPGPPPRPEVNAVERHAAPEQERGQIEAQVVALQARVVSQDLMRRYAIRGAAE